MTVQRVASRNSYTYLYILDLFNSVRRELECYTSVR